MMQEVSVRLKLFFSDKNTTGDWVVGGLVGGCVVVVVVVGLAVVTGLGGWSGSSGMGYSYLKISTVVLKFCFKEA